MEKQVMLLAACLPYSRRPFGTRLKLALGGRSSPVVSFERIAELLSEFGACSPQSESDWKAPIPLPPALLEFFVKVGPRDIYVPGFGNDIFFPNLSALWEYQAGYRWDGSTGARSSDWRPEWIVFADEGADPYIYCSKTSQVLHDQHGMGSWEPEAAFVDLPTMVACVASLGMVVKESGDDFVDDQSYVKSHNIATAIERLSEFVESEESARCIVENAGWV